MVKRLFDFFLALAALAALLPILVIAALGIRISSQGPLLYRAKRIGFRKRKFVMYKFRTMHVYHDQTRATITAKEDPRVFGFGLVLRRLKIDELPQLFNVLKGDIAIVGPRPEDPEIVESYYAHEHLETLTVLPGLASPGSIYNYTHGEKLLAGDDATRRYIENLLPVKLALDIVYVRNATFFYDLKIIVRTVYVIIAKAFGIVSFSDPPELDIANRNGLIARTGI